MRQHYAVWRLVPAGFCCLYAPFKERSCKGPFVLVVRVSEKIKGRFSFIYLLLRSLPVPC